MAKTKLAFAGLTCAGLLSGCASLREAQVKRKFDQTSMTIMCILPHLEDASKIVEEANHSAKTVGQKLKSHEALTTEDVAPLLSVANLGGQIHQCALVRHKEVEALRTTSGD